MVRNAPFVNRLGTLTIVWKISLYYIQLVADILSSAVVKDKHKRTNVGIFIALSPGLPDLDIRTSAADSSDEEIEEVVPMDVEPEVIEVLDDDTQMSMDVEVDGEFTGGDTCDNGQHFNSGASDGCLGSKRNGDEDDDRLSRPPSTRVSFINLSHPSLPHQIELLHCWLQSRDTRTSTHHGSRSGRRGKKRGSRKRKVSDEDTSDADDSNERVCAPSSLNAPFALSRLC